LNTSGLPICVPFFRLELRLREDFFFFVALRFLANYNPIWLNGSSLGRLLFKAEGIPERRASSSPMPSVL